MLVTVLSSEVPIEGALTGAASEAARSPGALEPGSASTQGAAPNYRLAAFALLLLALIWGYNWVVMKVGLEYSQPFTFAALRTFLGAVTLFIVLPIMRRSLRPRALGLTTLLGVLQTTGFVGLPTWALESGGAGKTAILTYTMPFWLLLMAWVVLGERLRGSNGWPSPWPSAG